MASPASKRPVMTLYSGSVDMDSHRVRIVLAEKGVFVDVIEIDRYDAPVEDLSELNPYGEVPTLVDRELVLYNARIIMEYLDERFPHPPLLPVYPVVRAKSRLMIYRIERDWYSLVHTIQTEKSQVKVQNARLALADSLISLAPAFAHSPYFFSDEFSLIDCTVAPILWRLPALGVELSKQAKPVLAYADRVFERSSFDASLTEAERELQLP
jgi:RNA polymerase-associated protein